MFVSIQDLCFRYPRADQLTLSNISISMKEGEILAILGESGSGKSTLLRLIAGIEIPQSGIIEVNNRILSNKHLYIPPEKRGIGMVFQDYALFPHMTVKANIQYGLKKMSRMKRNNRTKEMLELISMQGFEKRHPFELSGGQQQRVALARALAPCPSLLLLDEPFSNLDANLQKKIRSELREIIKNTGTTSIFVTHDEEDAYEIADTIVYIENGKLKNTLDSVHA